MTTLAPSQEMIQLRTQFLQQLPLLGKECQERHNRVFLSSNLRQPMGDSPQSQGFLELEVMVEVCQGIIMTAKDLFGSIEQLLDHLTQHSVSRTHARGTKDYFSAIAAFALQLEGPDYTQISHWLTPWYTDDNSLELRTRSAGLRLNLYDVEELARGLQSGFPKTISGMTPAIFKDGEYRGIKLQDSIFFSRVHNHAIDLIEECIDSVDRSQYWVEKLKEVEARDPTGWPILKEKIREKLIVMDVEGLEVLRQFVMGQALPNGQECSIRIDALVRSVVFGERDTNIQSQVKAIAPNELYRKDVLAVDLIEALRDFNDHYRDNDRGDEFNGGTNTTRLLTELFKQFNLNADELAAIAMKVCASLNRGQVRELQQKPVREQLRFAMQVIVEEKPYSLDAKSLHYAVLFALVKNLPVHLVSHMAGYNDEARAAIYTITGSAEHLKGIKDPKTIDNLMGGDLGL